MASRNFTISIAPRMSRSSSSRLSTWSWQPSQLAKLKKATLGFHVYMPSRRRLIWA